jgi:hypothetical protein
LDLSDTRITLEETNDFDNGYGGSSSYFSRQSFLVLFRGHRYRLQEITFSSATCRMTGDGETCRESEGEWKIQVRGGATTLVLTGDADTTYRIEKVIRGVLKLNGRDRTWTKL